MKLPHRDRARVPMRKLTNYLLSPSHPVGRSKARFFRSLGFEASDADALREELLTLARRGEVQETERTPYGTKYVVVGSLHTPGGEEAAVTTVWIVEASGPTAPRLVTAYPA